MTDTDPLATRLAEVEKNWRVFGEGTNEIPGLVAAIKAVLAQHQRGRVVILGTLCPRHKEHRNFSITDTEAADVVACQDCAATVFNACTGCGLPVSLESCPVREVIAANLLGEGSRAGAAVTGTGPPLKESPATRVAATPAQPEPRVTRFEVIDHRKDAPEPGRALVAYGVQVTLSRQDDGTTLKVFLDSRDAEGDHA